MLNDTNYNMKILIKSIVFLLVISNGQALNSQNEKEVIEPTKTSIHYENQNFKKLKPSYITTIKDYYNKEFGEGARVVESGNHKLLKLSYFHIPDEHDHSDYWIVTVNIPLVQNTGLDYNTILYGDLNNDKKADIVVIVYYEGAGSGIHSNDIFIFLNTDGKTESGFKTDSVFYGGHGNFIPKYIKDNLLIGTSSIPAEGDGANMHSLLYETKWVFKDNKFITQSSKKIK